MKSKAVLVSLVFTGYFFVFNMSGKADTVHGTSILPTDAALPAQETFLEVLPDSIDLSKLPFNEKQLPQFPVFNPPAVIIPLNKSLTRGFDRLLFPTREGMVPIEGKVSRQKKRNKTLRRWNIPHRLL